MKAEELRIGNILEMFGVKRVTGIKKRKSGKYFIELTRDVSEGHTQREWAPIDSLSIEPIPLTEEWLLKFGFEKSGYTYGRNELYFQLAHSEKNAIWKYTHTYPRQIEVHFVHQLQNLYFALTGTELTLNQ